MPSDEENGRRRRKGGEEEAGDDGVEDKRSRDHKRKRRSEKEVDVGGEKRRSKHRKEVEDEDEDELRDKRRHKHRKEKEHGRERDRHRDKESAEEEDVGRRHQDRESDDDDDGDDAGERRRGRTHDGADDARRPRGRDHEDEGEERRETRRKGDEDEQRHRPKEERREKKRHREEADAAGNGHGDGGEGEAGRRKGRDGGDREEEEGERGEMRREKEKPKEKERLREREKEKEKEREVTREKARETEKDKGRAKVDDAKDERRKEKGRGGREEQDEGDGATKGGREEGELEPGELPASLGLPPPPPPPLPRKDVAASLAKREADEKPKQPKGDPADQAEDRDARGSNNLADRVLKARGERLGRQGKEEEGRHKPKGREEKEEEEQQEDDISAWIEKSRALEQKKKKEEQQKALKMARMLQEQDEAEDEEEDDYEGQAGNKYNSRDLAGLKVRHGVEKVLQEGAAVVLTLKDSSILAGGDINEEEDELENVEIAEQKAREAAYRAAKKPNNVEDKFAEGMEGKKSMLPQYDEGGDEDDGVFKLDGGGGLSEEVKVRLDKARQRLQGSKPSPSTSQPPGSGEAVALGGLSMAKQQGDYYTPEEMATFKKPKVKKEKKLRRKKKEGVLDLDELEREAKAAGLGGAGDMGTRMGAGAEMVRRRRDEGESEERDRLARYEAALRKEKEASRVLREGDVLQVDAMEVDGEGSGGRKAKEEDVVIGDEDEDSDLQHSLERARQAALKKQQEQRLQGLEEEGGRAPPALAMASLVEGEAAVLARLAKIEKEEEAGVDRDAVQPKESLVFTDTGEFCRSLQLDETIGSRKVVGKGGAGHDLSGAVSGVSSVRGTPAVEAEPKAKPKPARSGGWMEVTMDGEAMEEDGKEEEEEEEEQLQEPLPEAEVGKGLAGALALLKDRGALKDEIEWGGRTLDKKKSKLIGVLDDDGKPTGELAFSKEVTIERRDEFGRIMTPKEAFRKMSYKFHGKGPGKMKQEKRIKQYEEDQQRKGMAAGDTPLQSVGKLREVQEQTSSPYVVISGHIKPGQISDPRSRFAMSEREPSPLTGNLTPMLGDKKVEHFLGISKKEEGRDSMPPPAARPPKPPRP